MAPMTRRRSARIASASKPNRGTPLKSLASVTERDEAAATMNLPVTVPRTPAGSSPKVPSNSEMNPSKSHNSLAPPSSAVRLGFADIPSTCRDSSRKSARHDSRMPESAETTAAMLQQTPSKTAAAPPSSSFTFRFSRTGEPKTAGDMGLSREALCMMEELREETLKIRADMEAEHEQERAKAEAEGQLFDANGRRIAKPKSRAGRFSDVHSAEFQKMDSIANHPSAFRAVPGRFTPVKTPAAPTTTAGSSIKRGLKRTQSKADLTDTPKPASSTEASSAGSAAALSTGKKPPMSLAGGIDERKTAASAQKDKTFHTNMPVPSAKRVKQHVHDDASSNRPILRDGSSLPRAATAAVLSIGSTTSIPRPPISTASLMTPTKPWIGRSASVKTPMTARPASSIVHATGLQRSVTMSSVQSPSTFDLARAKFASTVRLVNEEASNDSKRSGPAVAANMVAKRRALPLPTARMLPFSKTPGPPRVVKPVLKYPVTTPSRKLTKHVAFTPTTQRAVLAEKSPSLFRSFLPRSGLKSSDEGAAGKPGCSSTDERATASSPVPESPSVRRFGAVLYPDLSRHPLLLGLDDSEEAAPADTVTFTAKATTDSEDVQPSGPGTFTFRSDKTIRFGEKPPTGFGASPGQSSVRQVRESTVAGTMPPIPGGFPGGGASSTITEAVVKVGPNKENSRPVAMNIPHGIANKKRHRVSEAEEAAEEEAAERAAKRRRNEQVPEGEALMAPRLMGKSGSGSGSGSGRNTPRKLVQSTSNFAATLTKTPMMASAKKRPVLSLSRLNSLARPKLRK